MSHEKWKSLSRGYMALRWDILQRDNFTCQYCGQHAPDVKLEVDHVIPRVTGGTDDPENLKTCCYACNRGKEGLRVQRRGKPLTPRAALFLCEQIAEVLQGEPLTYKVIAERVGGKPKSVAVALSRHKELFAKTGVELWTLLKSKP